MCKNYLMLEKTPPNSSYLSKKHSPMHPKYTRGTHTSHSMSIDLITTTYYILFSLSHPPLIIHEHPANEVKEMKGNVSWRHVI